MPIKPATSLAQIEFATDDHDRTARMLARLFQAGTIEEEFCSALSTEGIVEVRHYALGEAMLQFVHPIDVNVDHYPHLKKYGPSVFNLTWFVKNIGDAIDACADAGFSPFWVHDIAQYAYAGLLAPENIVDDGRATMVNAIDTLGFNIEMAEIPWRNVPPKPFLCPAYHKPRPDSKDLVDALETINIVVADVEQARQAIALLFATSPASIDIASKGDEAQPAFSVTLGEVAICFYPAGASPEKAGFLEIYGSGIETLSYPTRHLDEIKRRCDAEGIQISEDKDALNLQAPGYSRASKWASAWRVHSRQAFGVDIILLT